MKSPRDPLPPTSPQGEPGGGASGSRADSEPGGEAQPGGASFDRARDVAGAWAARVGRQAAVLTAARADLALAGTLGTLDPAEEGAFRALGRLAEAGHSPSARSLVNASDAVLAMSLEAPSKAPPANLRERLLASARETLARKVLPGHETEPMAPAQGGGLVAPHERLTRLHQADPRDVERRETIDALAALDDREARDLALGRLLERLWPFIGFEIILVSAVRGEHTIHRVHRGFPAELGNMDIVPRAVSFCTHCVSGDEPFVVHDAAGEAFFRQAAVVREMGARSYVGVPLRAQRADGSAEVLGSGARPDAPIPIGALCCIGAVPRVVHPTDVALLSLFAIEAQARVAGIDPTSLDDVLEGAAREDLDVYREGWFAQILDTEIARARARSVEEAYPLPPPVLIVAPAVAEWGPVGGASSGLELARGWEQRLGRGARMLGSVRVDGELRAAWLVAGGHPVAAAEGRAEILARCPGAGIATLTGAIPDAGTWVRVAVAARSAG
jgi:uncharacterized protein YjiS (DUF1127 family)